MKHDVSQKYLLPWPAENYGLTQLSSTDMGAAFDLTADGVRQLGRELSNWGRWGTDDERGTLNFITPQCVVEACALPRTGAVISCAIDFDDQGPMGSVARGNPQHRIVETGEGQDFPGGFHYCDDVIHMNLQSATQWDSLAHVYYDGLLYNGRESAVVQPDGATANSIDKVRNGVVARGVLLDLPNWFGVPWLESGRAIMPDDLDQCAAAQGVRVRPGDVVLIRTGRPGQAVAEGGWGDFCEGPSAGLSIRCARWLHEQRVAAVAADNLAVEVQPSELDDCMVPLHMVCLRDMGLTFGEIFALEDLAVACASEQRYEFLFVAPPLPIMGAVASPINPLAIL